ncbi:putative ribonuclease H-like domain-containing protein [Tanacetum coccineum]|uniref:Ribonuclease H-like domain-containing protein n=1 Tax=Tanacetum coccineum TaxID=301880 RepID=A0ABQ5FNF0_9ASTR
MKARATLLMALPNKDQLKFHSYQDAKLLMEAIEKRYGGNKESKKVQRTLLKQQYENFAALSSESMDQTFDRLQKLISQLEIQGEVINQEDMNLKLLRSLPSEWKTHALIWRNKVEIETISLDDLYNNLKIYEQEITGSSSTSQNSQNVAFVSNSTNNTNNTNKADDTAHGVSTTHTQGNGVNYTSLDNLCDAVICAFLASQPNSPQLSQEDLEQLHPDDLEEMDLQWEMAMLTIRARRFIKRTGKKLDINGQRVGFDKSKVECFNCHKHGHFARECRFLRNQEYKGRENNTRTIAVETPTQNALIAQDGIGGYDWSYQAEEEQPTNHALMAFTSSGSSSSSDSEVDSCSKTCVKAYASLKEQYDNLSSDYKKSQFNLVSYKAGLESVEARLAHYKKNEVVFEESINVLKLEVRLRDNALNEYKMNLEKAETERDQLKQTLEKFQNSSKSLNNILESQVIDKFKTGLGYDAATAASPAVESFVNLTDKSGSDKGYHSVPPPLTGNFIPRKPDLTFVDEIVESENLDVTTVVTPSNNKTVENKGVSNTVESNAVRMNNTSAPIIEDWNSDDESEIDYTVRPNTEKIESVKTVRETDAPKQNKQYLRGNQRNWNNLMSQRLGSNTANTKAVNIVRPVNTANTKAVNTVRPVNTANTKAVNTVRSVNTAASKSIGNQQQKEYKEKGVIDSGCSRHMTGNKCYLDEYEDYDGGFVSFGDGKGRISGKGDMRGIQCARTPQQNGVAERRNRTLIEAARTMLVTLMVSKAMRVFNKRTRIVEETLNIKFLENTTNVKGNGPDWHFDVDSLSIYMNYVLVAAGNKTIGIAGTKDNIAACQAQKEKEPEQEYILIPLCTTDPLISQGPKDCEGDAGMKPTDVDDNKASDKSGKHGQEARSESEMLNKKEMQTEHTNSSNGINTFSTPVSTAGPSFDIVVPSTPVNTAGPSVSTANKSKEQLFERFSPFKNAFSLPPVPNISSMDNTGIFGYAYDDEDVEEEVDMNNVISSYTVPDTSFTEFHKDHLEDQVIGSLKTHVQTRHMTKTNEEHIGTKWVFKNKKDKRGIVVKNKARLVAQGHTQEQIEEEVYVCQPPGFEDPHFSDKVYKIEKGSLWTTSGPKSMVYVDDISFGSTKKQMSNEFETLMHDKFQNDSWENFFIFWDLFKSTPLETNKALVKDEEA